MRERRIAITLKHHQELQFLEKNNF